MKPPPLFLAALFAILALPQVMLAEAAKLSGTDRQSIVNAKQVTRSKGCGKIPAEVVRACKGLGGYGDFELADPGQPFQVTDVITEKHLLGRRLIWAVIISRLRRHSLRRAAGTPIHFRWWSWPWTPRKRRASSGKPIRGQGR